MARTNEGRPFAVVATEATGALGRLIQELGKLPGVGPKSAERLAHHLLSADKSEALALAEAIRALKEELHVCRECHHVADGELCAICSNPKRDPAQLCVVEHSRDLMTLEKAGVYGGLYHVLGGRIAPLENIGPEQLTVDHLLRRVQEGGVREVIMATNPTMEGDGTALYISSLLAPTGVKITRLARGLPSGSSLEFANRDMLADALEGRRGF
jgi:recombination protein RecR